MFFSAMRTIDVQCCPDGGLAEGNNNDCDVIVIV